MDNFFTGWFFAFVMGIMSMGGWAAAHMTVLWECRNVGAFYVGSIVFDCTERIKK